MYYFNMLLWLSEVDSRLCARPYVFFQSLLPFFISGDFHLARRSHNELRANSQRLYTHIFLLFFFFVFLKMLHSAARVHFHTSSLRYRLSLSLSLSLPPSVPVNYPPPGFSLYALSRRPFDSKSWHALPHVQERNRTVNKDVARSDAEHKRNRFFRSFKWVAIEMIRTWERPFRISRYTCKVDTCGMILHLVMRIGDPVSVSDRTPTCSTRRSVRNLVIAIV